MNAGFLNRALVIKNLFSILDGSGYMCLDGARLPFSNTHSSSRGKNLIVSCDVFECTEPQHGQVLKDAGVKIGIRYMPNNFIWQAAKRTAMRSSFFIYLYFNFYT